MCLFIPENVSSLKNCKGIDLISTSIFANDVLAKSENKKNA